FRFVVRWRPPVRSVSRSDASFGRTIVIGLEYAWRTRSQRIVLARSMLWMLCASALWGLLPLVARREFALDAPGYGFLVSCVGLGAICGALVLPRLRRRWPTNV